MINLCHNSGTQDTTQDFVNIESIHENMIINKSGIAIMMIGLEAISRELMTEISTAPCTFISRYGSVSPFYSAIIFVACITCSFSVINSRDIASRLC